MENSLAYTRTVGLITVVSGFLAVLCLVVSAVALADHPDAFSNPALILDIPDVNVSLLRWSMIADLLGYYLLLIPLIYWWLPLLQKQTPWAHVITFCATGYVLIGAIGAAILAAIVPPLLAEYAVANTTEHDAIRIVYKTLMNMVYGGLWNLLETLLAGLWWMVAGFYLIQFGKALRWTTLLLGAFTLLDGLGNMLELELVAAIGLNVYLILAPVWAIWFGMAVWRSAKK